MTRLIDADELIYRIDRYWERAQRIKKPKIGETAVMLDIKAIICSAPTIEARPIHHSTRKDENGEEWVIGENGWERKEE